MRNTYTILNFHRIASKESQIPYARDPYCIQLDFFSLILDALAFLPEVKITFDDGYESDYDFAFPALKKRKLHAVFFVATSLIGKKEHLSKTQTSILIRENFEIGSHGALHCDWRTLSDIELDNEIVSARKDLEDWFGISIRDISIPFGSYDRRVMRKIRQAGFEHVYTSDGGVAKENSWIQPRNTVRGKDSFADVLRLLRTAGVSSQIINHRLRAFLKRLR
jgi:peptidoglycan/xylan/chitin deacetylase (PgdA/CDA1 family)